MLKPGMFISDRYEIIDMVGSGGMADVYKAKDQRLNRFVAIKILKPEYSSDKSFVNKFRGEAQSAAGLSHPNIVNVYDVGDDSGLHYIVMELVEGITLKRFIEKKGKLEVKEAVGIAIQIAQGMEAAHDNHIIHRDIKPQNIIISRDGKVKVTDFGIAKATNSNTITSNAMGSVHYLSPEQARGGYSDEKSDIYSLGVTIYEMLSGKVPFAGDNTVSVALLHIQGEAMPLRELDPNIPVSLDKIVQKCMQKRPERRYHSASELIADLKRAIANPNGDFVQIPSFVANDSPTINISDDLGKIKSGSYLSNDMRDSRSNPNAISPEDEEELDTVDSKVEKLFAVGSIVAIVILALAIIFLIVWFVFPRGKKGPDNPEGQITEAPTPEPTEEATPSPEPDPTVATYVFPAVLGHTEEDAREAILAKDPKAEIIRNEDYSDEYEKGYVMAQYPLANSEFPAGSEVIITVSVGPKSFMIPYVYGITEEQADRKLRDYDLIPKMEYVSSSEIAKGHVISTDPVKESLVVADDTITVYVSTGPESGQVAVPYLINETEETATQLLTEAGLGLGTVTREASDNFEIGRVSYQSTTAGEMVNPGTTIDITVSSGQESTQTGSNTTAEFIGELTIDDVNPFEYGYGDGEAEIILELEQDGYGTEIYNQMTSIMDFPLHVPDIEGESNSIGVVKMYIDGELFKMPGEEDPYVWIVEFKAVEE